MEPDMGIRENIDKNRGLTTIITTVVILLAVGVSVYSLWPSGPEQQSRTYFTIDEGKTWFADSIIKAPPFEYQGKTAYRLRLYTCDEGKTKFPGYVMRYTPEGKKKLAAAVEAAQKAGTPLVGALGALTGSDIEIRALGGESNPWYPIGDFGKTGSIRNIKCPGGQGTLDTVEP
jgi:hypothetical protein